MATEEPQLQVQADKNLKVLLRHIKHVQDACLLLGERLIEKGEEKFGRLLIANSFLHDNSKFRGVEWDCLNGGETSPDKLKQAIHQHNSTNQHHVEFWDSIDAMPRIFLAEMVADWYSRSIEFGTNLREWIKDSAYEKYNIPPNGKAAKSIKEFVDLLLEEPFKKLK